ncbi:hypothetical protein AB4240_09320 [Vibrio splendidus]
MKIAIFELTTPNHSSMVDNWIRICELNKWEYTLFLSPEVSAKISGAKVDNIVLVSSFKDIFKSHRELNKHDYILFNTVQSRFITFLMITIFARPNKILSIHNANSWFQKYSWSKEVFFNYKLRSKVISHVIRLGVKTLRRLILDNVDFVSVNSVNIKKYIESEYEFKRPITVIPFSMKYFDTINSLKNEHLNIVYPGIVDENKKDYDLFIELSTKFPRLKFTLLGKFDKERNKSLFSRVSQCPNIMTFEDYIPNSDFTEMMSKADLIFSQVNVKYWGEIYGESKDSGISYLMSEFSLPLLVNSDFKNIQCLDDITYKYRSNAEAEEIIKFILNGDISLSKTRERIKINRKELSLCNVSKSINKILGV